MLNYALLVLNVLIFYVSNVSKHVKSNFNFHYEKLSQCSYNKYNIESRVPILSYLNPTAPVLFAIFIAIANSLFYSYCSDACTPQYKYYSLYFTTLSVEGDNHVGLFRFNKDKTNDLFLCQGSRRASSYLLI